MKSVLSVGIRVHLVAGTACLQRDLERRPQCVDWFVIVGIVDEEGRLDIRHSGRLRRSPVEWDRCLKISTERRGKKIGRAAAPTEAGDAKLSSGLGMRLQMSCAVEHVRA